MKIYLVVEMADVELLGVRAFKTRKAADKMFDIFIKQNNATEETDLTNEITGTIRIAGDDAYSGQLLSVDVE